LTTIGQPVLTNALKEKSLGSYLCGNCGPYANNSRLNLAFADLHQRKSIKLIPNFLTRPGLLMERPPGVGSPDWGGVARAASGQASRREAKRIARRAFTSRRGVKGKTSPIIECYGDTPEGGLS
jgi:hypothetical protein